MFGLCLPTVSRWGLDTLINTDKMERYYEKDLRSRSVVFNELGQPVHPDTCQKSVRVCNRWAERKLFSQTTKFLFFFFTRSIFRSLFDHSTLSSFSGYQNLFWTFRFSSSIRSWLSFNLVRNLNHLTIKLALPVPRTPLQVQKNQRYVNDSQSFIFPRLLSWHEKKKKKNMFRRVCCPKRKRARRWYA